MEEPEIEPAERDKMLKRLNPEEENSDLNKQTKLQKKDDDGDKSVNRERDRDNFKENEENETDSEDENEEQENSKAIQYDKEIQDLKQRQLLNQKAGQLISQMHSETQELSQAFTQNIPLHNPEMEMDWDIPEAQTLPEELQSQKLNCLELLIAANEEEDLEKKEKILTFIEANFKKTNDKNEKFSISMGIFGVIFTIGGGIVAVLTIVGIVATPVGIAFGAVSIVVLLITRLPSITRKFAQDRNMEKSMRLSADIKDKDKEINQELQMQDKARKEYNLNLEKDNKRLKLQSQKKINTQSSAPVDSNTRKQQLRQETEKQGKERQEKKEQEKKNAIQDLKTIFDQCIQGEISSEAAMKMIQDAAKEKGILLNEDDTKKHYEEQLQKQKEKNKKKQEEQKEKEKSMTEEEKIQRDLNSYLASDIPPQAAMKVISDQYKDIETRRKDFFEEVKKNYKIKYKENYDKKQSQEKKEIEKESNYKPVEKQINREIEKNKENEL